MLKKIIYIGPKKLRNNRDIILVKNKNQKLKVNNGL